MHGKIGKGAIEIGIAFDIRHAVSHCQVRTHCAAGVSATIETLEIEFCEVDAASVETAVCDGLGATPTPLVRRGRTQQLRGLLRHPLREPHKRLETALIDRLPLPVAERTAEFLAHGPGLRFVKKSGMPSLSLSDSLTGPLRSSDINTANICKARIAWSATSTMGVYPVCEAMGLPVNLKRKSWESGSSGIT